VPQVTGLAREEFIFDHLENPALATLSYPAADLDPAHTKLTVRQREADSRATPSDLSVKFDGPNRIAINRRLALMPARSMNSFTLPKTRR
jgi:hypothetical protein